MSERTGTSATKAKNKWNTGNYDRLYPYVKKGKKAEYEEAANKGGFESLNDFVEKTLDEKAAQILGRENQ